MIRSGLIQKNKKLLDAIKLYDAEMFSSFGMLSQVDDRTMQRYFAMQTSEGG